MRKYYVYYNDGCADDGGVGFEMFHSKEDALAFIEKRLTNATDSDLTQYTVIEGVEVRLRAKTHVLRVCEAE